MKRVSFIVSFFFLTSVLWATTWFPAEHTCPVCKKKSTYQDIGSYGTYIYNWPSKYQYIFWPLTDFPSVYSCPGCHFSVYMWDFDSIPAEKTDTLKSYLSNIKMEKKYKDYLDIPMTIRLEIAEGVYRILGRDTEFWCKFYRVMGYHYEAEDQAERARSSRLKAIGLVHQMFSDTLYKGQEKELMLIAAAMHYYTGQKDSTLLYLDKANLLTYSNSEMQEQNVKGLDDYLSGLIEQYKAFIKEEEE